jgi:hypothetical protein
MRLTFSGSITAICLLALATAIIFVVVVQVPQGALAR